jgi:hypothetical protein
VHGARSSNLLLLKKLVQVHLGGGGGGGIRRLRRLTVSVATSRQFFVPDKRLCYDSWRTWFREEVLIFVSRCCLMAEDDVISSLVQYFVSALKRQARNTTTI